MSLQVMRIWYIS